MGEELLTHRHPQAGFSISLPASWERVEDPKEGVALVAVEPDREEGFRANVVVTCEELPTGVDLDAWQGSAEELLARTLDDFLLVDRERLELDGRAVLRRLAHHAMEGTQAVTLEQWAMVHESMGYTLSASIGTLAYDSLADLFAEMGRTFRPALDEATA